MLDKIKMFIRVLLVFETSQLDPTYRLHHFDPDSLLLTTGEETIENRTQQKRVTQNRVIGCEGCDFCE